MLFSVLFLVICFTSNANILIRHPLETFPLRHLVSEEIAKHTGQAHGRNPSPWKFKFQSGSNATKLSKELSEGIDAPHIFHPNSSMHDDNESFTKVFGGSTPSSFLNRHMAYIIMEFPENQWGSCTASILSQSVLITAAHCFLPDPCTAAENIYVFLSNDLGNPIEPPYLVRSAGVHYSFNPTTVEHDIAMIEIDGTFRTRQNSVYITPSLFWLREGSELYAAGYGLDENGVSGNLNEVDLIYQNTSTCKSRTSPGLHQILDHDKVLCATASTFPNEGGKDTCHGDSGGPLYRAGQSGTFRYLIQIGVTSFGGQMNCGLKDSVSWYTNVATYFPDVFAFVYRNFTAWESIVENDSSS